MRVTIGDVVRRFNGQRSVCIGRFFCVSSGKRVPCFYDIDGKGVAVVDSSPFPLPHFKARLGTDFVAAATGWAALARSHNATAYSRQGNEAFARSSDLVYRCSLRVHRLLRLARIF